MSVCSVRGTCARCGHSRVALDSVLCPRCHFHKQDRQLRVRYMAHLREKRLRQGGAPLRIHTVQPMFRFGWPKPPPPKRAGRLTAADLNRTKLQCWICGGSHARIVCPREHLRSGSFGRWVPKSSGPVMHYSAAAARAYWEILVALGYVEGGR